MQEDYPIPATGEIPYLYFEVPANFDEDRWVQAWEMRPGNPAVGAPRDRLRAPPPDAARATAGAGHPTSAGRR